MFDFAEKSGRISSFLKGLSEDAQTEAMIDMMVSEAIKTSEIEGEYLSRKDIMSSIRNNLGLTKNSEEVQDKKAEGAAELIIDVRNSYSETLTKEKLFSWYTMIMKGSKGIQISEWRSHEEPMQIISGALGKEKVHYEAPPSVKVSVEMARFVKWFNDTAPGGQK